MWVRMIEIVRLDANGRMENVWIHTEICVRRRILVNCEASEWNCIIMFSKSDRFNWNYLCQTDNSQIKWIFQFFSFQKEICVPCSVIWLKAFGKFLCLLCLIVVFWINFYDPICVCPLIVIANICPLAHHFNQMMCSTFVCFHSIVLHQFSFHCFCLSALRRLTTNATKMKQTHIPYVRFDWNSCTWVNTLFRHVDYSIVYKMPRWHTNGKL